MSEHFTDDVDKRVYYVGGYGRVAANGIAAHSFKSDGLKLLGLRAGRPTDPVPLAGYLNFDVASRWWYFPVIVTLGVLLLFMGWAWWWVLLFLPLFAFWLLLWPLWLEWLKSPWWALSTSVVTLFVGLGKDSDAEFEVVEVRRDDGTLVWPAARGAAVVVVFGWPWWVRVWVVVGYMVRNSFRYDRDG